MATKKKKTNSADKRIASQDKALTKRLKSTGGATSYDVATNRPNIATPFYDQVYERDPKTGQTTVRQTINPREQQLLEEQRIQDQMLNDQIRNGNYDQKIAKALAEPGPVYKQVEVQDPSQLQAQAEQRIQDFYKRRLDTQYTQEAERFRQNLADRGIQPGTPRYAQELQQFEQNKRDAYFDADARALAEGRSQASQMLDTTALQLDAARQGYEGAMMQRTQPMTEMAQILGMQHGPRLPNDPVVPNIDVTGMAGIQAQKDMQGKQLAAVKGFGGGGGGGGSGAPAAPEAPPPGMGGKYFSGTTPQAASKVGFTGGSATSGGFFGQRRGLQFGGQKRAY